MPGAQGVTRKRQGDLACSENFDQHIFGLHSYSVFLWRCAGYILQTSTSIPLPRDGCISATVSFSGDTNRRVAALPFVGLDDLPTAPSPGAKTDLIWNV